MAASSAEFGRFDPQLSPIETAQFAEPAEPALQRKTRKRLGNAFQGQNRISALGPAFATAVSGQARV